MINPFNQTVKSESAPLVRIVIISGKTNKKKETSIKQGQDIQISNVSVKSKLKHSPPPPPAYPGHLTSFPAREGGDLMNLVFPGAGNLITTHRGGEFDR